MIDMHNHVLFGVDDGCKTVEESLQMIQAAVKEGVTDIIFTPHYAPMRGYVESNDVIHKNFDTIQQEVTAKELPIRIFLGREIDEVKGIEELLRNKTISTINDTKYVLVDFGMKKTDVDEYLYELIINGYKPIVAHPERYNYITNTADFHTWKKTGALLQINASSLFHPKNKQVKKHVKYLLKHGLVDLLGSDCHRNPRNYEDFSKAMELIEKKYSNNTLKQDIFFKGGSGHENV
jgi:protein-tyrosine phosphatase